MNYLRNEPTNTYSNVTRSYWGVQNFRAFYSNTRVKRLTRVVWASRQGTSTVNR